MDAALIRRAQELAERGEPFVQATVVRIRGAREGLAIFEMENGQIWAQVEPQPSRNVRVGDVVTIERGALGSFRLISPRGGMAHRVRRQN